MDGREKAAIIGNIVFSVILLIAFNVVIARNDALRAADANICGSLIIVAICILYIMLYLRVEVGSDIPQFILTTIIILIGICIIACGLIFAAQVMTSIDDPTLMDEELPDLINEMSNPWIFALSFTPIFAGCANYVLLLMWACNDSEVPTIGYYICYACGFIVAVLLAYFVSVSISALIMIVLIGSSFIVDIFVVRQFIREGYD